MLDSSFCVVKSNSGVWLDKCFLITRNADNQFSGLNEVICASYDYSPPICLAFITKNYFLFEQFIDIFGSHLAKLLIFTVSNSIYSHKIRPRSLEYPKQPKPIKFWSTYLPGLGVNWQALQAILPP